MASICVAPSCAHADTFTRAEGEARIITSAVFTTSAKGFDNRGHVTDINNYDQNQVYVLGEYGLTDDVTLVVAPSFRNINIEGSAGTTGLGYTDLGGRVRFLQSGNWSFSAQGLVRIPGNGRSQNVAQLANSSTDFDGRVGLAYAGSAAFASAEGGYRFRSGDLPNEFHFDISAGTHLSEDFMVLAFMANTISDGRGQGVFGQEYRYGDASLSGAYSLTRNLTFQAGYTGTLYGRNSLRQRGPFLGFWYNF